MTDKPWDNERRLKDLYQRQGLSAYEIADRFDCSPKAIYNAMDRHRIDRRETHAARRRATLKKPACFETDHHGYETWRNRHNDEQVRVRVHRLLAVALYGFDAVRGKHVHHENGIRWDNRPGNLSVISPAEHGELHKTNVSDYAILSHIKENPDTSARELTDTLPLRYRTANGRLKQLYDEGALDRSGSGNGSSPYRYSIAEQQAGQVEVLA
jgi:hypothetical protein